MSDDVRPEKGRQFMNGLHSCKAPLFTITETGLAPYIIHELKFAANRGTPSRKIATTFRSWAA